MCVDYCKTVVNEDYFSFEYVNYECICCKGKLFTPTGEDTKMYKFEQIVSRDYDCWQYLKDS